MRQTGKTIEVKIKLPDEIRSGVYANWMQATHTREEFCMDFISAFQGSGIVTARVICSPRHFKRIISALMDNLKKYEAKFGRIEIEGDAEDRVKIGFTSSD